MIKYVTQNQIRGLRVRMVAEGMSALRTQSTGLNAAREQAEHCKQRE
jgi:hypothetical protein